MLVKHFLSFLLACTWIVASYAAQGPPPRLVLVISLDQFPFQYMTRFGGQFSRNGFGYLLQHGANFTSASYKHAQTSTGPGHAVILSGIYGSQSGIITNTWYDTRLGKTVYCVRDTSVSIVGAGGDGISPANFLGSTLGDQLKIHFNFRSRVVSLSHKDRAAVLLGGKLADVVLWMVDSLFVTSTYYAWALPAWAEEFNRSRIVTSYFGKTWEKMLPEAAYAVCDSDTVSYENGGNGLGTSFPHLITGNDPRRITKSYFSALRTSPFGNAVLLELAKRALEGERLGLRGVPDLLCLSFSVPDYVGHHFGPYSQEALDIVVRTDRALADLFGYVDRHVGLKNCVIVLTSDHGIAPQPEYIRSHRNTIDIRRVSPTSIREYCERSLANTYGGTGDSKEWIQRIVARNIYINNQVVGTKRLSMDIVARTLADSLQKKPEVATALAREALAALVPHTTLERRMKNSYHPLRSGDVMYALRPYFYEDDGSTGAEHGAPYEYDAHVPMIIVGRGVQPGTYAAETSPVDIAPTLSSLLGIEFPPTYDGRILVEALVRQSKQR